MSCRCSCARAIRRGRRRHRSGGGSVTQPSDEIDRGVRKSFSRIEERIMVRHG
jgi:hypothetical protein